jgi:hypothetical protein
MFTLLDCFALLAGFAVARGKEQLPNPGRDAAILLVVAVVISSVTFLWGEAQAGILGIVGLAASFGAGYFYGNTSKHFVEHEDNSTAPVELTS